MRSIPFFSIRNESINATKIEAVERMWKDGNLNIYPDGRGENIISYTMEGNKTIFDEKGHELCTLSAPAIVLISKGTPYVSRTDVHGDGRGHTICIRFALYADDGEEVRLDEAFHVWNDDADRHLLEKFRAVLKAYLAADCSPLLLKARLFDLLHSLCENRPQENEDGEFRAILPAVRYIEKHLDETISVSALANMCFLSESYFRSKFREYTGMSPTEYHKQLRIAKAQELLESSLWTVDLVAEKLGFCDTSHFYKVYKKVTGKTPRELS